METLSTNHTDPQRSKEIVCGKKKSLLLHEPQKAHRRNMIECPLNLTFCFLRQGIIAQTRLSLRSKKSTCLCLLIAKIKHPIWDKPWMRNCQDHPRSLWEVLSLCCSASRPASSIPHGSCCSGEASSWARVTLYGTASKPAWVLALLSLSDTVAYKAEINPFLL